MGGDRDAVDLGEVGADKFKFGGGELKGNVGIDGRDGGGDDRFVGSLGIGGGGVDIRGVCMLTRGGVIFIGAGT